MQVDGFKKYQKKIITILKFMIKKSFNSARTFMHVSKTQKLNFGAKIEFLISHDFFCRMIVNRKGYKAVQADRNSFLLLEKLFSSRHESHLNLLSKAISNQENNPITLKNMAVTILFAAYQDVLCD